MQTIHLTWNKLSYNNNRLQYVVAFLDAHPLKPKAVRVVSNLALPKLESIYYGEDSNATIPAHNMFFNEAIAHPPNYQSKSFDYKGHKLFGVVKNSSTESIFYQDGKFAFDILETIFFHIARYEEYYAAEEDNGYTNCLEETKQFLVKHELYNFPVVDHIVKAFFECILQIEINRKTSYSISHDIDLLWRFKPSYKIVRNVLADIYHRRGMGKIKRGISYFRKMKKEKLKDPYDVFHFLFRSESLWTSKVLYLMSGGETKFDNKYSIDDPKIAEIIVEARKNGYQIGLHPSYNCLDKPGLYAEEKIRLEGITSDAVYNNRQHVLRWNWKITPHILSDYNIQTDSTMGYTRRLGFRSGTGFPYKLYNYRDETSFDWIELPMSFMESSAIHYASANNTSISKVFSAFLEQNKFNTHIEMNVHNSNFDPTLLYGEEMTHFYTNTLKEIIG